MKPPKNCKVINSSEQNFKASPTGQKSASNLYVSSTKVNQFQTNSNKFTSVRQSIENGLSTNFNSAKKQKSVLGLSSAT